MSGFLAVGRVGLATGLAVLLLAGQAAAHPGHGYGHHGHRGHHAGTHVGVHYGRGHFGHRRHRHGGVSLAWYGPLYVGPRRHAVYETAPAVVVQSTRAPRALPDMPAFEYLPLEGQGADRLTEERRGCERQAWRATRPDPAGGTVFEERSVRYVEARHSPGSPIPSAASGALLGAIGGAIGGDAGLGAAIGAAVGAASWLIGSAEAHAVSVPQEVVRRQYVPAPGPDAAALGAALMACMEARGYDVR